MNNSVIFFIPKNTPYMYFVFAHLPCSAKNAPSTITFMSLVKEEINSSFLLVNLCTMKPYVPDCIAF